MAMNLNTIEQSRTFFETMYEIVVLFAVNVRFIGEYRFMSMKYCKEKSTA